VLAQFLVLVDQDSTMFVLDAFRVSVVQAIDRPFDPYYFAVTTGPVPG